MKCPHCLEEILDGARICRYCGKKQALSGAAKVEKQKQLFFIVLSVPVGLCCLCLVFATWYHNQIELRVEAAARCSGTVTADELRHEAEVAAKESGQSYPETVSVAIAMACPRMASDQ
jgi:hypothetical protein